MTRQMRASARTALRRRSERGSRDLGVIRSILDEALVCHVGLVMDGRPYVIPMNHGRLGDRLYLHGHRQSRALSHLAAGGEACVSVALVDGLVLGPSACEHAVNYRSVVLFGAASMVTDAAERLRALRCITDHVVPGRWTQVRRPNADQLGDVVVVSIPIDEGSAKVRSGSPAGGDSTGAPDTWVGVIPLKLEAGTPVAALGVPAGIEPPALRRPSTRLRSRPGPVERHPPVAQADK